MWSFFFVIFGLIVWLCAKISDWYNEMTSAQNINHFNQCVDQISEMLDKEKREIIDKLTSTETMQATLDEIAPELRELFGDDWKTYFPNTYQMKQTIDKECYPAYMAMEILLSKRGRATYDGARYGYYIGIGSEEDVELRIACCKIIERNILNFYPCQDFHMEFVPREKPTVSKNRVYYDDYKHGGYLKWNYAIDHYKCSPPSWPLW